MVWVQLIWFVVTTILTIALSPKPKAPRAAAIDDFQFPTAEEGRPIPVIFGTVDITGPNVVWYGDLSTSKIKKKSLFSSQTVGYKYFIGFHIILCHGEADAITRIAWGEREAWTGDITANGSGHIEQEELFGGNSREGGVIGDFDVLFGGDGQGVNAYLLGHVGTEIAYTGVVSFVWKGGYVGTTSYVKPLAIRVQRIHAGWQGAEWNPADAEVGDGLMNPAHIVYQVLTDTEWGMGIPTSFINDASFQDAADLFKAEGFGLSINWNQQATIEEFLQIVVDHVGAVIALRNDTGQYELTPVRGDYDPDDLIVLDPSNVVELSDYQRQGWGDTVNEVTLVYTDPDTGKDTTISAHDLGNQQAQGRTVPQTIELRGIRSHDVAKQVVMRELASRVTPLGKGKLIVNRVGWHLPYNDVFKLTWPDRGLDEVVHRILSINRGTMREGQIVIEFVEDIYAQELGDYISTEPQSSDPDAVPTPTDDPDPGMGVISTTLSVTPSNPYPGDRYYIPNSPAATGAWAGHEGTLAEWDEDENTWTYLDVPDGTLVYDTSTGDTLQQQAGDLAPFGGGGSLTIIDEDTDPDEVIEDATDLLFRDADITNLSTGGVRIKVSPLTAKGDLYTRTSTAVARLPIGTEGNYLRARAAGASGMAWESAPAPVGEGASAARGYKDATQSIADSTLVALTWPVEDFDTDSYHSTVSNTSRFTAALAGKYIAACSILWDSNTTGVRELYVCVNGSTATRIAGNVQPASAGLVQTVVAHLDLAASDYVEFYVRQNSGTSRAVGSTTERVSVGGISRVGVTAAPTMMRGATWTRSVAITTPTRDVHVRCPVKGVITSVSIGTNGGVGSCVVDIWKDTHANFPPTVTDTICASAKPTISAGLKYEDTTLTGWTTTVNAGDWLTFHLQSSSTFTDIFAQLFIKETQ